MRGAQEGALKDKLQEGIIPADAGSTYKQAYHRKAG